MKISIRFDPNKIKVRRRWIMNPRTRVVPNKKVYNRRRERKDLRKYLGKVGGY